MFSPVVYIILFFLISQEFYGNIFSWPIKVEDRKISHLIAFHPKHTTDTLDIETTRFSFTEYKMGTYFRIILYASDQNMANMAAKEAFEKMDQLNLVFSDYIENSEINQLSASSGKAGYFRCSTSLFEVVEKSLIISEASKGAFDITVGPYVKLWRRAIRQQKLPSPEAISAAKAMVGYDKIILNKDSIQVKLGVPGMQLDVGGIAKGYILDEAMKVLKIRGINSALIDGGGDILVSNAPPDKKGWILELSSGNGPQKKTLITLCNSSVATSGDNYRYVEFEGKRYSHIIDPHSGYGLVDQYTVSVIAEDGATADALASAISVTGPEEGLQLIKKFKGSAVNIFSEKKGENSSWRSDNFQKFLVKDD